jgi:hypothetical protein
MVKATSHNLYLSLCFILCIGPVIAITNDTNQEGKNLYLSVQRSRIIFMRFQLRVLLRLRPIPVHTWLIKILKSAKNGNHLKRIFFLYTNTTIYSSGYFVLENRNLFQILERCANSAADPGRNLPPFFGPQNPVSGKIFPDL